MQRADEAIVFDVIETLLDLNALDPHFACVFGKPEAREEWFARPLRSAFVVTVVGDYMPFGALAAKVLDAIAGRHGRALSESERRTILATMRQLPPHPDAVPPLTRLRDTGLRLAALTNSAAEAANAQLDHAGLTPFFERVLTVDAVSRFKPAGEVYQSAASAMGVAPRDMWMVAAHGWDVAGAMRAGCKTAFLARPGQFLDPAFESPQIVEPDLNAIATRLLARRASPS